MSEELLVSALLAKPELLASCSDLGLDHFAGFRPRLIYSTIRNVEAIGIDITVESVVGYLENEGKGDAFSDGRPDGTRMYLERLRDSATHADSETVVKLAGAVRQRAVDLLDVMRDAYGDAQPDETYEPEVQAVTPFVKVGKTWADCVEQIYERCKEPWVEIKIQNTVIAIARSRSFLAFVAPSSAGKSSLLIQMLVAHAMDYGPAIYVTHELDGDEAVARAIGQQVGYSWGSVLKGEVPRALISNVDRWRCLDRDEANEEALEKTVAEMRGTYPGQPILVVVDYLQATPAPPGKERGHVAGISTRLRIAAKRLNVVIIGVSQASTGNAKAMRSGELIGIDASSTGAETSQIERDAYVILTLGDRRDIDPETTAWALSTAKARMGKPDLVHELHHRGRIGVWDVVGEPKTATEVRNGRDTERNTRAVSTLRNAIEGYVSKSSKPVYKADISRDVHGNSKLKAAATAELLEEGVFVTVLGQKKGGTHPLWTAEKAAVLGGS